MSEAGWVSWDFESCIDHFERAHSRIFRQREGSEVFGASGAALVESRLACTVWSMVYQAQTPQGQGLYVISPLGNSGNYFLNSTQAATRDQGLVQAFLPKFQLGVRISLKWAWMPTG